MFRTYKFKSDHTNKCKLDLVRKTGQVYKRYYNKLIKNTVSEFYKNTGKTSKFLPQLSFQNNFSERYKQTCGKQVKTNFESWLSNVKNRVIEKVTESNLSEETKKHLYFINKYGLWFKREIKIKEKLIPQETIKLSRKIYHHCKGRYPKLRSIEMNLDQKIAKIEKSNNSFDYWVKLATLRKGRPIYLPIESYKYFENKRGILKKQIQIIIKPDKIEFGFVKDVIYEKKEFIKDKKVGIDIGLVIPLTTSTGNQYGQNLYNRLKRIDDQIINLTKMRMKNGLYKQSNKLKRLYNKTQNLLKNEIGRITNEFYKKEKPEEVILENNKNLVKDLKNFSSKMRRIIRNSGINIIRDVLIEKGFLLGSKTFRVNQAYTSQECPKCHCIDSKNRKTQSIFKCIKCGYTRNADYVGSINIRDRRSITSVNIYTQHNKVRGLIGAYYKSHLSFRQEPCIVGPSLTVSLWDRMTEENPVSIC